MLLCDNVLDMMPQFTVNLAQAAVFAPLARSEADEIPRGRVHRLLHYRVELPAGLDLEDGNEIRRVDQRFVFRTFAIAQSTLVSPFRQRIDPFLYPGVNLQIDDATRRLPIETPAQRL